MLPCWFYRATLEVHSTVSWMEPGGYMVLPATVPPAAATKCESPPSSPECLPSSTGSTQWEPFTFDTKSEVYIFTMYQCFHLFTGLPSIVNYSVTWRHWIQIKAASRTNNDVFMSQNNQQGAIAAQIIRIVYILTITLTFCSKKGEENLTKQQTGGFLKMSLLFRGAGCWNG